MNEFDHVEIKLDEWGKGSVIVNGHPLKSSLGVTLEANGGETTIVTIRLLAAADVDVLVKGVKDRLAIPMQNDEE